MRAAFDRLASAQPIWSLAVLSLAYLLWAVSLTGVDPRQMDDLGLLSVLPPTYYAALVMVIGSSCVLIARNEARTWLFLLHIALLILIIHGTPAILYDTLRYSWAWKHAGLVDYIQRHGSVNPHSTYLTAYHNWPGFFILSAMIVEVAGLPNALVIAPWAQVFFQLLNVSCLVIIYRALTTDRRVIRLGILIFCLTDWVGQDYFSPQAFVYFLHLAILAICLTWFRQTDVPMLNALGARLLPNKLKIRLQSVLERAWLTGSSDVASQPRQRIGLLAVVILFFTALTFSHQLTPFMTISALLLLVLCQRCTIRAFPVLMAVIVTVWIVYAATPYLEPTLEEVIESFGQLSENTRLINLATASSGQRLIALAGRVLTLATIGLACLGILRQIRRGQWQLSGMALMLAPALVLVTNSYGGEMIFRVYLFLLPSATFFAAALVYPSRASGHAPWMPLATIGLCCALLAGFLFPYYGKERQYFFSKGEVAAVNYLFEVAPRNSLIVSGSLNYPAQFRNNEYYVNVPINREPFESQLEISNDPVGVLSRWLDNGKYAATYLIFTRSQKAEIEMVGKLPLGVSLQEVEDKIVKSPKFKLIFSNEDAKIFVLSSPPGAVATR